MVFCKQATELMTEDREGKLAGSTLAWFRFHLVLCKHCRTYRRQLDLTIAETKEVARDEVPADVEERLLLAFRSRKDRP